MTFDAYKKLFIAKASDSGYSQDIIDRCLHYAEKLFSNNVPVIYNTSHFAALVGYEKSYIKRAVYHTESFYREFKILKRNKTTRTISEPLPSLKEVQSWILNNILYKIEVSKFAKAYLPNVTLKQNLVFHREQPKVFKVDIKNFFPSIKLSDIEVIFETIGYSKIISNLLAKLCCLNEKLPQGASTSPYLTNIFLKDCDHRISSYCLQRKIRFTRYADDLTFSGDFNEEELYEFVKSEIEKVGLELNISKTKLIKQNNRQMVTGVVVNEKIQVVRYKRKQVRQEIYFIRTRGLKSHLDWIKNSKSNYLGHLLGKINFVLFINSEDKEFQEYKKFVEDQMLGIT